MGRIKDWYIRGWKETLNNPMKGLGRTILGALFLTVIAGFSCSYFFYEGDYIMVVVSLGILLIPSEMLYDSVYVPMKRYRERYGDTGAGDDFEKEALETGKPIRTVLRY
jgi:ABC-type glycerol-3-phosphate transport system permease component